MKRPMLMLAAAWFAGLILAKTQPGHEINTIVSCYFFFIFLGLLYVKKYPHLLSKYVQAEWYPQLTLLILILPLVFLAGKGRMEQVLVEQQQDGAPWKELWQQGETQVFVQGTVKEKRCEDRTLLILTDCVLAGYYGEENIPAGDCQITVEEEGKVWLPETFVGNEIRVYGKLSVFQEATNPGQFNAKEYYEGKGLYASIKAARITVLNDRKNRLGHSVFLLKQKMRKSLEELYPVEKAGVLAAMMLGDKDLLDEEVKLLYQQNGISHILAISGLHISMLCMGLFRGLKKLGLPMKLSMAVAAVFLVLYICYTGASTSSLRAGIMCLVLFGGMVFRRSYDLLSSLAFAAILVTALRPTELTSAGFLLSFGAVLGVAMAKEVERFWQHPLLFGGVLQLITTPISLWFYYELSPYSIILNLIVIPLVSLILGGGLISMLLGMFVPMVAKLFAGGVYLLLEFYEWLCGMAQKLPWSFVLVGRPAVWQLTVYYAVLALVLWWFLHHTIKVDETEEGLRLAQERQLKQSVLRLLGGGVLALILLFLPQPQSPELLFLDVSQGDGVLIFTGEGTVILSDCGSSDVSAVGQYRLSPVLKQKGVALLDMAVVSHLDSDHVSGIKELLEAMPVYEGRNHFARNYKGAIGIVELVLPKVQEKSEAYVELETLAQSKQVAVRYLEAGGVLYQEEELLMECLAPENARESENDTSLVFLLQTPQVVVWLMGDAGTEPEKALIERLKNVTLETVMQDRLVVLKVGHHGSKTSSGEAFLSFIHPDISVISCGYQNSYGHPHASVLEQLSEVGSQVYRTDLQGAVLVELGETGEGAVFSWLDTK